MIRRIVPLHAHFSLQESVFREALEWGSRLHLPIHALCLQSKGKSADHDEQACAEACARLGVPWELTHHSTPGRAGLAALVRPDDLFLLAQKHEPAEKSFVSRCAGGRNGPALGVCPDTFSP